MIDAGAEDTLASIKSTPIQGIQHDDKGSTITPDMTSSDVEPGALTGCCCPAGSAIPTNSGWHRRHSNETFRALSVVSRTEAIRIAHPFQRLRLIAASGLPVSKRGG
ncbi:hypothetical protein [Sphingomonas nostoxanthinifaciens]|uniref:hypothetical protein n=1 Tax=Sphingomonas nostoxanthinifaciens TaxID=2872652 RepID=UPI001CC1FC72|nr:hypothetical protein [Sphingomonas nostoxanthinifaciens]UAK25499.1 hypothetical protein K8P63_04855 [Sphingomonas nostoxanthinifaciens]